MERKEGASLDTEDKQKIMTLSSLKGELENIDTMEPPLLSGCCIYRVPPNIRKVYEKPYTPSLVSIGPFHHRDQRLKPMQELKSWCLKKFLNRKGTDWKKWFDDCAEALRAKEYEIRHCYSEAIPMTSDEFVSMILTDACFIIELFIMFSFELDDPLVDKPWPRLDIMSDLILLENQLPFFVLRDLFNETFPEGLHGGISFLELTFQNLLGSFMPSIYPNDIQPMVQKFTFNYYVDRHLKLPNGHILEVEHLCHMLRTFYLSSHQPERDSNPKHHSCSYTATQLYEAGIIFELVKDRSILELECSEGFLEGKLRMPIIGMNGLTEIMLRNVVAFEQCHLPSEHYVTDHIFLLDKLINTEKDVEVLVKNGIIQNLMGDNNEVASMVNKLIKNVYSIDINANYVTLYEKLDRFYNNPLHKYKATFMRDYWSTPWTKASIIIATTLVLLTLIQTICSIIPLFKKIPFSTN